MPNVCKTCGGPIGGYVCDECGEKMEQCDPAHPCGAEHCQPRCTGCGEAEANCTCE